MTLPPWRRRQGSHAGGALFGACPDPHLLEQMIRNLLGNAIKYTRQWQGVAGLSSAW
jgi:hypothetical protein